MRIRIYSTRRERVPSMLVQPPPEPEINSGGCRGDTFKSFILISWHLSLKPDVTFARTLIEQPQFLSLSPTPTRRFLVGSVLGKQLINRNNWPNRHSGVRLATSDFRRIGTASRAPEISDAKNKCQVMLVFQSDRAVHSEQQKERWADKEDVLFFVSKP